MIARRIHGVTGALARWYNVTRAHGTPDGFLWKYASANDSLAGRVMLGNFPATTPITPVADLRARRRVASVDVGQQAGGSDFWRMRPSR
jgi:hypothetical protein